jgi:hypothetical protein
MPEQEKKKGTRICDTRIKKVRIEPSMETKFSELVKKFDSVQACLLHLIKTHPEYKLLK